MMTRQLMASAMAFVCAVPVAAQTTEQAAPATHAAPATPDTPTAPPAAITISGSVGVVSDYRFRGVSQSDQNFAIQGGITITHKSGFYIATWGSNLAAWGTFGGANLELDAIGGYKHKLAGGTIDVGVTVYTYPGGADKTAFAEPYAKLSGTIATLSLTAGVAYAPPQQALGRWYNTGADAAAGVYNHPGDKKDNTYLWGDGALAFAGTPITGKAHIGHSWGNRGLGPNGTSVTPTGSYWDWSLGADATYRNLTLNVSYIGTDITDRKAAYLRPSFSRGQDGTGNIAGSTVVASITASF